jgi:hypothetical protein
LAAPPENDQIHGGDEAVTPGPAEEAHALVEALCALDALEIPWTITGSVALAAHGIVRATQDADVKILVSPGGGHEEPLALEMRRRGFSRIDEHTFEAADHFVVGFYPVEGRLDEETFARRQRLDALPAYGQSVWVVTAEGLILLKLREFLRTRAHVQLDDVRMLLAARRHEIDIDGIEAGVRRHGLGDAWGSIQPDV